MNKKGQIFSLDFLLSMIIVILIIGTIINTTEIKTYNTKKNIENQQIEENLDLAIKTILTTPKFNCDTNGQILKYTLDINKIKNLKTEIKNVLGLNKYYTQIIIGAEEIIFEDTPNTTLIKEIIIQTCENSENFKLMDLNNCRLSNCYSNFLQEQKLIIGVGK